MYVFRCPNCGEMLLLVEEKPVKGVLVGTTLHSTYAVEGFYNIKCDKCGFQCKREPYLPDLWVEINEIYTTKLGKEILKTKFPHLKHEDWNV